VTKKLSQPIEEPPPPERDAAALDRYDRKDKNLLAEIILGVKAQHRISLSEASTALQACEALEEVFQSKTSAGKVQLTRKLATVRMGDGKALIKFVEQSKTLPAELTRAAHPVGADTVVLHVLARLPPAVKTVTTVLLAAEVSLQRDQLLSALRAVQVEQKEASQRAAGSRLWRAALITALEVVAGVASEHQPLREHSGSSAGTARSRATAVTSAASWRQKKGGGVEPVAVALGALTTALLVQCRSKLL